MQRFKSFREAAPHVVTIPVVVARKDARSTLFHYVFDGHRTNCGQWLVTPLERLQGEFYPICDACQQAG